MRRMTDEGRRQVHLDFHTSELIPAIGGAFSRRQFQEALRIGHIDQINVFAKCHHSWSYYPTKIGIPHPELRIDLLGEQIEACRQIGVRAPIYYTVGWSAHDAETHPEWCMRREDGGFVARDWPAGAHPDDPKPTFQWKLLCPRGEYHELVMAQTEEICRTFPVDGLWYDIYQAHELCYCEQCLRGMRDSGTDASDPRAVEAYRARTILEHCRSVSGLIASIRPRASIYFNGLTSIERPQNFQHRLYRWNTKNDLEDLPTTWGGYDKFPLRAKLFHRERKPVVAMSGKFHTAWGEFGGYKDPQAIRFEAASMIAFGAHCNFGDHLHPSGLADETTYGNLGHAFEYVELIEEYGIGGLPAASLGVWPSYDLAADEGVTRMLLEEQIDFDVAASGDDLSRFEAIVVPSKAGVLDGAAIELTRYVEQGGSLLVLGEGVLDGARTATAVDVAAAFVGTAGYDVDYTVVDPGLGGSQGSADTLRRPLRLPSTPFLNYEPALRFAPRSEAEVLAGIEEPYFSRTYGAYCGHQNTPNRGVRAPHPAAWRSGRIVVAAHALDRLYYRHGAKVHRDLFRALLDRLHRSPLAEAALPSAGRISLLLQADRRRYVLHLLYGSPILRGRCHVIEDLPRMTDVRVRLRLPEAVKRLRLVPDGVELPLGRVPTAGGSAATGRSTPADAAWSAAAVETVVPSFTAHCAVVAEY